MMWKNKIIIKRRQNATGHPSDFSIMEFKMKVPVSRKFSVFTQTGVWDIIAIAIATAAPHRRPRSHFAVTAGLAKSVKIMLKKKQ